MEWWQDIYNRQLYFDLYEEEDTTLAPKQVDYLVKLLNLQPPAKILDLCCGYGRHSIELAKREYEVTGVDISKKQIQRARENAHKAGVKVDFQVEDARKLNFQDEFDVVINMFLSFGYFRTKSEDITMLKGVFKALRPSGKFLMDFWNREKEIRNFQPAYFERIKDVIVLKEWEFDYLGGRLNWKNTVIYPDGKREIFEHSIRAYTVVELKQLTENVGLKLKGVYGSLSGEKFTIDSQTVIVLATKPK